MHELPPPEFSRPFAIEKIEAAPRREAIQATAEEKAALVKRLELVSLKRLEAEFVLRRRKDGILQVTGSLEAELEQPCVISLEPVPALVQDSFEEFFIEETTRPLARKEVEVLAPDDMAEDVPEPVDNGIIDLGELVTQNLSLAMDPFPRKDGVEIPAEWRGTDPDDPDAALAEDVPAPNPASAPEPGEKRPSPFAILAQLKDSKSS